MSDHSDLVARLRGCAETYRVHASLGLVRKFFPEALSELASILEESADALDVKPGANADAVLALLTGGKADE